MDQSKPNLEVLAAKVSALEQHNEHLKYELQNIRIFMQGLHRKLIELNMEVSDG